MDGNRRDWTVFVWLATAAAIFAMRCMYTFPRPYWWMWLVACIVAATLAFIMWLRLPNG